MRGKLPSQSKWFYIILMRTKRDRPPVLAPASLCLTLMLLAACSSPVNARKPTSRKTARQMEHYNSLYGGAPVLGEPSPDDQYVPRSQQEGFTNFQVR